MEACGLACLFRLRGASDPVGRLSLPDLSPSGKEDDPDMAAPR